jgi:hypothetical protein
LLRFLSSPEACRKLDCSSFLEFTWLASCDVRSSSALISSR